MPLSWGNAPSPRDVSKDWPLFEPGPLVDTGDWPEPLVRNVSLDIPRPEPIPAEFSGDLNDPDVYARVQEAIYHRAQCNTVRLREEGFYAHLPSTKPVWNEFPGAFFLCRIHECKDFGREFVKPGKERKWTALRKHLKTHKELDDPSWELPVRSKSRKREVAPPGPPPSPRRAARDRSTATTPAAGANTPTAAPVSVSDTPAAAPTNISDGRDRG